MGGKRWTQEEIDILIKYKDKSIKEYIHLLPQRNQKTIEVKRTSMGLTNQDRCNELNAVCLHCKREFHEFPSRLKGNVFCSRDCYKNWKSQNMKGEKNHFYGKTHTEEVIKKIINANLGKPSENKKWTNDKLIELKNYLLSGLTYYEIAKILNMKKQNLMPIVRKYNLLEFYTARYKNKSEGHLKLKNILNELFPNNIFKDELYIKTIRQYIDIVDLSNKIYYEFNGIQHYVQKSTWNRDDKDFELQQERDKRKYNYCKENNIPLIIIKYDEKLDKQLIINKLKEQGINYEDTCQKQVSSF